ncbi:M48 family metallopeptidase [Brackiella oedipodis]|uniref:M48 family metallopeptidase n=1 Tax=Brackiella oedipodis TaxID=124225 RepID=UPI000684BB65|nr:SprT family zinc-dependent metalloprotease [Brackiella oedipodis]
MTYTNHVPPIAAVWQDGGHFAYLGQKIQLKIRRQGIGHVYQGDFNDPSQDDRLLLTIPDSESLSAKLICQYVEEWLQGRALVFFRQRAKYWSQYSGLAPSKIAITKASRRWGSCASNKVIRLNWQLMRLSPALIDYVIVHELAHLKHMNHSDLFWAEVARIMPDYNTPHQLLKTVNLSAYI